MLFEATLHDAVSTVPVQICHQPLDVSRRFACLYKRAYSYSWYLCLLAKSVRAELGKLLPGMQNCFLFLIYGGHMTISMGGGAPDT